jgi:hypothetical protein
MAKRLSEATATAYEELQQRILEIEGCVNAQEAAPRYL